MKKVFGWLFIFWISQMGCIYGQAAICSEYPATAYIFFKRSGANGAGHVAYGIRTQDVVIYGSINGKNGENELHTYNCGNCTVNDTKMLEWAQSNEYDGYLHQESYYFDFLSAIQEMEARHRTTYSLLKQNCAHGVSEIIREFLPYRDDFNEVVAKNFDAYSVISLSPTPNGWVNNLQKDGWKVTEF